MNGPPTVSCPGLHVPGGIAPHTFTFRDALVAVIQCWLWVPVLFFSGTHGSEDQYHKSLWYWGSFPSDLLKRRKIGKKTPLTCSAAEEQLPPQLGNRAAGQDVPPRFLANQNLEGQLRPATLLPDWSERHSPGYLWFFWSLSSLWLAMPIWWGKTGHLVLLIILVLVHPYLHNLRKSGVSFIV